MIRGLILFFFIGSTLLGISQVDYNFLTLRGVPQSVSSNPAQMPRFTSHLGLPVISSLRANVYSSSIKWGDIIKVADDGRPIINMSSAIDRLDDKNYLSMQLEIDLFSASYRLKSNYFSFAVKERIEFKFNYPKSFVELLWYGNGEQLLGEKVYLDGLGIDFNHFREYAFGISHDFEGKMILGARVKYLVGIANFTTDRSELFFITDENSYATFVGGQYSAKTAGFFDEKGGSADYAIIGSKNKGLALDLGARYKISDKWEVAGSLTDFGFINWKENAVTRYDDSVFFFYNGVSVNNIFALEGTVDSLETVLLTSIDTTFTFKNISSDYKTTLSSSISVGAHYHLNKMVELSAYYNHFTYRGQYIPAFVLNSRFALRNWIELSANYSIYGSHLFNFGAGAVLNLGPFQFYGVTNNLLAHFNPSTSTNANMRVGMNLIFGRKKYKR